MASPEHQQNVGNFSQLLDLYKAMDALKPGESLDKLHRDKVKGLLIRLTQHAVYQQAQIEALYRAVQVLAEALPEGIPEEVQVALNLRPPVGEFPDVEDFPDKKEVDEPEQGA